MDGVLEKCLWCCYGVWCCFGCERSRHGGGDQCEDPERQEAGDVQLTVLLRFERQDGGTKDITLSNSEKEQELDLSNNQLSGPIPEQLGKLSALQRLLLSNNQLSGPIPEQLGKLSALQRLGLYDNQLSGPIPEQLGNLSALQWLNLSNNQLSGPIPEQLGNLSTLQGLYLYDNQLSGPIPEQLGNLSALQGLNLSNNQLSGPIPEQLGKLSALQWLDLSNNQLSGPIPEQLGNLSALQVLYLYNNQLSGPIPEQLGNLSALQVLNLSNNQLSGPIPEQLGNLSALQELDLCNNHLEGKVPPPLVMKVSLKIDGNSGLTTGDVVSLEAPQFPVYLIPRDHLLKLSAFEKHEVMTEQGMVWKVECEPGSKLCNFVVSETKESLRREDCVFISHRWLQKNHPDDDSQTKLRHVQLFAQTHSQYLYYWVDYACIPQAEEHGEEKCKAINSLPCYVKSCGALITVYSDQNERSSLAEYRNRGWCRLEQLSTLVPLHTTRPLLGDNAKGELAITKVYLSEIGGDITEFDLLKQGALGSGALMELNPLEGQFVDDKDKDRISECLTEMCRVFKNYHSALENYAAIENLVRSIENSQTS